MKSLFSDGKVKMALITTNSNEFLTMGELLL